MSAGGLHGIDPVVVSTTWSRAFRYDRSTDTAELLHISKPERLASLRCHVVECAPSFKGVAVVFVADQEKYAAVYRNHVSLIWRDCGTLLQAVGMSAYALGYASCALGIHGAPIVDALALSTSRHLACGVLLVGSQSGGGKWAAHTT
jgi:hypothetical protein